MRQLLKAQWPDLPGHLRAVLALWVEGTLLALHVCQDTVTPTLVHKTISHALVQGLPPGGPLLVPTPGHQRGCLLRHGRVGSACTMPREPAGAAK